MKTKLLTLSAIFIFTSLALNSQIGFGLLGGVNFQNLNGKNNDGDKLENDMIIGYHAGVNVQIPIVPEFFFQPGLLLSTKGAKNTYGTLMGTYRISYIELPLNVVYKASLGKGKIMIGLGPYIGYAVGGKAILDAGSSNVKTDIKFKNALEEGDPVLVAYFKAFDAGGNIFAGYEMNSGIFMQLNAQYGMIKINPEDRRDLVVFGDKLSVKNTGFGLSIGYRF